MLVVSKVVVAVPQGHITSQKKQIMDVCVGGAGVYPLLSPVEPWQTGDLFYFPSCYFRYRHICSFLPLQFQSKSGNNEKTVKRHRFQASIPWTGREVKFLHSPCVYHRSQMCRVAHYFLAHSSPSPQYFLPSLPPLRLISDSLNNPRSNVSTSKTITFN